MSIETSRSSYHHGDLRAALLAAARDMIAEAGIEGLSLRKLAERAGVSRTAPYHHFQDKNDLLCAIAAEGFSADTERRLPRSMIPVRRKGKNLKPISAITFALLLRAQNSMS